MKKKKDSKELVFTLSWLKRNYYLLHAAANNLNVLIDDVCDMDINPSTSVAWQRDAAFVMTSLVPDYVKYLEEKGTGFLSTVPKLCRYANVIADEIEVHLPEQLLRLIDEAEKDDYRFYESCGYGKFWNEVKMPEIVALLFSRFCELVRANLNGEYSILIYDIILKQMEKL